MSTQRNNHSRHQYLRGQQDYRAWQKASDIADAYISPPTNPYRHQDAAWRIAWSNGWNDMARNPF